MWGVPVTGSRFGLPRPKDVAAEAAELAELVEADKQLVMPHAPEVAQFYRQALGWYGNRWPERWRERPKSARWWGWCQTRTKFRFDEQTPIPRDFWEAPPSGASVETAGWLKSQ